MTLIRYEEAVPAEVAEPLSTLGATIMGLSIGVVVLVLVYCLVKVLTLPPAEPGTSDEPH